MSLVRKGLEELRKVKKGITPRSEQEYKRIGNWYQDEDLPLTTTNNTL